MGSENKVELAKLRNMRLEKIGYIIGIVASLVFAVLSFFREEKEGTAKEIYKELAKQQEEASKERVQLQKDLAAIRGYLAAKAEKPSFFKLMPDEEKEERVAVIKPKIGVATTAVTVSTVSPVKVAAIPAEKPRDLPVVRAKPKEYIAPPVEDMVQAAAAK